MPQIRLKYGRTVVPFDYDEGRFDVLGGDESSAPLTDVEIGERFDSPIGSEPLEETIAPGDSHAADGLRTDRESARPQVDRERRGAV
jgi:hypothetical protein